MEKHTKEQETLVTGIIRKVTGCQGFGSCGYEVAYTLIEEAYHQGRTQTISEFKEKLKNLPCMREEHMYHINKTAQEMKA